LLVDKTGGPDEHEALRLLEEYVRANASSPVR